MGRYQVDFMGEPNEERNSVCNRTAFIEAENPEEAMRKLRYDYEVKFVRRVRLAGPRSAPVKP